MSDTVSHGCWQALTVSRIPWSCCMSITVSYGCWLSLIFYLVPWSCFMSITVSYGYWLYLTVSLRAMELLHVSKCLLWLLAVTHCLTGPME